MSKFHDTDISKTQKIAGYMLSLLFTFMIIVAGVLKIVGETDITERMNNIPNWGDKLIFVGVLELLLLALYWIPKTQKLGFYLLCAFVGGIIVAEVAAGTHVEQDTPPAPLVGIVTAVFLYAGTFLRKPSLIKQKTMK